MKKQFLIILTVVCGIMFALMLAACGQPATSDGSDSAESAEVESTDAAESSASEGEYTGLPTLQPADHEGRTADMCPTCHTEGSGGAPTIPEDHFVDGELDGARLQCITCHVLEPAA